MSELNESYPSEHVNLVQMNRVLRHRLRNLSCGMKMAIERIVDQTAEIRPEIAVSSRVMLNELERLELFTRRMDWLFAPMPAAEPCTLFDLVRHLREQFDAAFPLLALELSGPEADLSFLHGSWLSVALWELTANAADASAGEFPVRLKWKNSDCFQITVCSHGDIWPEDIPFDPPQPFATHRGRHDGLGLAIARRVTDLLQGTLEKHLDKDGWVFVSLTLPSEETRE